MGPRARIFGAVLAAISCVSAGSSEKNLTPFGDQEPLLVQLEKPLEHAGVDVRSSYSRLSLKGTRAVLAPLGELPAGPPPEPWPEVEKDFKRGAFGFLTAVRSSTAVQPVESPHAGAADGVSTSIDSAAAWKAEMRKAWVAADPNSRIFLSFTSGDRAAAMKVRRALEDQGFAVFTYLKDAGPPLFTVEEVGSFFREAGKRFVLDTPAARRSTGVWIERSVQQAFLQQTTIEAAMSQLKGDQTSLRGWIKERTPLLRADGDKVRSASAPLEKNLLLRAQALDRILASFADENDSRRKYLKDVIFEWWLRLGEKPSERPLDADALQTEASLFRHEMTILRKDTKTYPAQSPLLSRQFATISRERIVFKEKTPQQVVDIKKLWDEQRLKRERDDADFGRARRGNQSPDRPEEWRRPEGVER